MSEPFFFQGRWVIFYHDHQGKRKRKVLGKTKAEAFGKWKASLRAGTERSNRTPLFSTVANKWLEVQEQRLSDGEVSAAWAARVSRTAEAFMVKHPKIRCDKITEAIATDWGGTQAYRRTEAQVIRQILKWAVPKFLDTSPLSDMKLSKGGRREVLIDIDVHKQICRVDNLPSFRVLLWLCWWTGCRPIELRNLRWEEIAKDNTHAILRRHKNSKKKGPRVLYFPPNAAAILTRHRCTSGPVFKNSKGRPWTKDALSRRVNSLAARTGFTLTAYAYRHSFITRAMLSGTDVATVAELTGTSIEMISRNYGHLDKAKAHLHKAAASVPSSVD